MCFLLTSVRSSNHQHLAPRTPKTPADIEMPRSRHKNTRLIMQLSIGESEIQFYTAKKKKYGCTDCRSDYLSVVCQIRVNLQKLKKSKATGRSCVLFFLLSQDNETREVSSIFLPPQLPRRPSFINILLSFCHVSLRCACTFSKLQMAD